MKLSINQFKALITTNGIFQTGLRFLSAAPLIFIQHTRAAEPLKVKDLMGLWINGIPFIEYFYQQTGITLELNETIYANPENEGKDIRYETLDRFSILVPLLDARGVENKQGF